MYTQRIPSHTGLDLTHFRLYSFCYCRCCVLELVKLRVKAWQVQMAFVYLFIICSPRGSFWQLATLDVQKSKMSKSIPFSKLRSPLALPYVRVYMAINLTIMTIISRTPRHKTFKTDSRTHIGHIGGCFFFMFDVYRCIYKKNEAYTKLH